MFEERFRPILNALSITGLLFTLIVMFALKGDLIVEEPEVILLVAFARKTHQMLFKRMV